MARETDTVTLPAYWATALINDDYSGIDDHDRRTGRNEATRIRAEIARLAADGWRIVSCGEDPWFTWRYRLYDPGADCDGGDVLDYQIIR